MSNIYTSCARWCRTNWKWPVLLDWPALLVNLFSKGSKTLSVWIGFHVQYTCNTDRGKSGRAEWLFTGTANIQLLVPKVVNSNSSYNFQDNRFACVRKRMVQLNRSTVISSLLYTERSTHDTRTVNENSRYSSSSQELAVPFTMCTPQHISATNF